MRLLSESVMVLLGFFAIVLIASSRANKRQKGTESEGIRGRNSRERRQNHQQHHRRRHPMDRSSSPSAELDGDTRRPKKLPLRPFVVKCPHTEEKNLSAVLWSLNGTVLFSVHFGGSDGTEAVDVVNEGKADAEVRRERWRTAGGGVALILRTRGGRFRVEAEDARGKRWFVLRIEEMDVREERGEWKCQVLVRHGDTGMRVQAESRKIVGDRWAEAADIDQEAEDGEVLVVNRNMRKRAPHQHRKSRKHAGWAELNRQQDTAFAFSKTDTDFVVFERTDTERRLTAASSDTGDAIAYSRMESPPNGEMEDDLWLRRWRSVIDGSDHRRNQSVGKSKPIVQLYLLTFILCIHFMFPYCQFIRIY